MLTRTIDVYETPPPLKELLSLVTTGTDVVFVEHGMPVARLVTVSPRVPGLHAGTIWTSDDFDQPLAEEFWTGDAVMTKYTDRVRW